MTHRRIFIVLLVLITTVGLSPGGLRAQDGGDVPMFQGNAARTGEMPGPGPDPSIGVQVRWRFAIGGAVFASSPAVVDGVVYVGSSDVNSGNGSVYALDAATGTERWRFPADSYLYAPTVADNVVYVSSGDGNLYALEAAQPLLQNGATAEVTADGTALQGGPAETTVVRAELAKGTRVTITGEGQMGADTEWWPVTVIETGMPGWIQGTSLQAVWPET